MSTFFSRGQPVMRRSVDAVWPLRFLDRDSDGSGEAGQTAKQAGPAGRQRGPSGIAKNLTSEPSQ